MAAIRKGSLQVNRIVIALVCLTGFLFALGINASVFVNVALIILMVGCGLSYIFKGKPLNDFWLLLLALVIGPRVIAAILAALLGNSHFNLKSIMENVWLGLFLLAAMLISFFYVRHR